jgi:hypothetical protein
MTPKIDLVSQSEAKKDVLIIGVQVGLFGYILRLGLYRKW